MFKSLLNKGHCNITRTRQHEDPPHLHNARDSVWQRDRASWSRCLWALVIPTATLSAGVQRVLVSVSLGAGHPNPNPIRRSPARLGLGVSGRWSSQPQPYPPESSASWSRCLWALVIPTPTLSAGVQRVLVSVSLGAGHPNPNPIRRSPARLGLGVSGRWSSQPQPYSSQDALPRVLPTLFCWLLYLNGPHVQR